MGTIAMFPFSSVLMTWWLVYTFPNALQPGTLAVTSSSFSHAVLYDEA